jgi:hypothetical protein
MSVAARTRATSSSAIATPRTVLAGSGYRREARAPARRAGGFFAAVRFVAVRLAVDFVAVAFFAARFFVAARFAVDFLAVTRVAVAFFAARFFVAARFAVDFFTADALAEVFLARVAGRRVDADDARRAGRAGRVAPAARTAWAADSRAMGTRNGEQLT